MGRNPTLLTSISLKHFSSEDKSYLSRLYSLFLPDAKSIQESTYKYKTEDEYSKFDSTQVKDKLIWKILYILMLIVNPREESGSKSNITISKARRLKS